ncbi:MAG: low temperature requirement protein A [Rothia sp. (in: high G+C Gram-positive bacteria)]|uniref:low temperature requirement protein A n=1 Tax=Rothia sp. (in: high G+C Gram-positive bacteria) TaxID=1885016 RepID=UPI0026E0D720|nr:low temperature requirement protein A [Rothia sp. (in: high G+C Gram-positive bacteria)]MDO5750844.1 low temperature requirement protein A [Rothia sp. (in: high G+C Gram-positive bacteria)]
MQPCRWYRAPHEPHRVASTLELFFDLVFVIAVGIAGTQLHHALSHGHVFPGVMAFLFIFFCIWWAWMNFTWFATAFDNDDWVYRAMTFLQMGGVLTMAAGIAPFFESNDIVVAATGYVIMRVAMCAQWVRAGMNNPEYSRVAYTYAAGIAIMQVYWVISGMMHLPAPWNSVALIIGMVGELSVPVLAERKQQTPWHAHHITERYGLFTLIVLGESLLGSANAIIAGVNEGHLDWRLIAIAVMALVVAGGMWWIYFWGEHHIAIGGVGETLPYGYLHYLIFAAAGAYSAGVELMIDVVSHQAHGIDRVTAAYALAIPVAVFVIVVWALVIRRQAKPVVTGVIHASVVLILIDPLIPVPAVLTIIAMIAMVWVLVVNEPVADDSEQHAQVEAA